MKITKINHEKRTDALSLALKVFMKYEAPDYSEEGIVTFKNIIENEAHENTLEMYGAYDNEKLVGVIATRKNSTHISLFFVDENYHRKGIGRDLFKEVVKNCFADVITVNSSPYAVEVYHRLGFIDVDSEQVIDGIRFTPMIYTK